MKTAEQAIGALKSWLKTDDGFGYIQQMAARYARDSLQHGALTTYLGNRFSRNPGELQEEIAQEFLEFLLASFLPELHSRPDQVAMILSDQTSKVLRFALQQFTWRLQGTARKKDVNPRAYLYRRIREVLNDDKNFVIHKDSRNNLAYSPATDAKNIREDPAIFSTLDYASLPVPPELVKGRDSLFTAQYLSGAALFFQQETGLQLRGNYAVPLRELVRYLAMHYPWINRHQPDSLSDAHDSPENGKVTEEQFDRNLALDSIAVLAAQFAMDMDEQARKIFLWILDDPPVSLKEIARRLDMPDHNRVYRLHQKTIASMKKFTSSWPGPPLEELPNDVGLTFIEAIKNICEKSLS